MAKKPSRKDARPRCGDSGGKTSTGRPCRSLALSHGRCVKHKDAGGRPPYEPSESDKRFVEVCALGGINQDEICKALGVSKPTLHKYYREELDNAYIRGNAQVVQSAFQQAVSGKSPAMTIFWLKTRMGWREVQHIEMEDGPERTARNREERALRIQELKLVLGEE